MQSRRPGRYLRLAPTHHRRPGRHCRRCHRRASPSSVTASADTTELTGWSYAGFDIAAIAAAAPVTGVAASTAAAAVAATAGSKAGHVVVADFPTRKRHAPARDVDSPAISVAGISARAAVAAIGAAATVYAVATDAANAAGCCRIATLAANAAAVAVAACAARTAEAPRAAARLVACELRIRHIRLTARQVKAASGTRPTCAPLRRRQHPVHHPRRWLPSLPYRRRRRAPGCLERSC